MMQINYEERKRVGISKDTVIPMLPKVVWAITMVAVQLIGSVSAIVLVVANEVQLQAAAIAAFVLTIFNKTGDSHY